MVSTVFVVDVNGIIAIVDKDCKDTNKACGVWFVAAAEDCKWWDDPDESVINGVDGDDDRVEDPMVPKDDDWGWRDGDVDWFIPDDAEDDGSGACDEGNPTDVNGRVWCDNDAEAKKYQIIIILMTLNEMHWFSFFSTFNIFIYILNIFIL